MSKEFEEINLNCKLTFCPPITEIMREREGEKGRFLCVYEHEEIVSSCGSYSEPRLEFWNSLLVKCQETQIIASCPDCYRTSVFEMYGL